MKKKVIALFMMVVLFCVMLSPLSAHAETNGVVPNGESVQTDPAHEKTTGTGGKTVARIHFQNVETGLIEPDVVIVGTIACDDAGGYWMECGWHVTSTSKITRVNLDVSCSTGGTHGFSYGLNTPDYQAWNTVDEYCGGPGRYFAELSGFVTTLAGQYKLVPAMADYTTIR